MKVAIRFPVPRVLKASFSSFCSRENKVQWALRKSIAMKRRSRQRN
jgi:hypothetical protein